MKNMLEEFDSDDLQRVMQIMRPYPPEDRAHKLRELAKTGEIEPTLLAALLDYFPDVSSPELALGSAFGKYIITDLFGEGGMGRVYQAWDPDLMRNVAIKLIRPELMGLEEEYRNRGLKTPEERFREETAALASLQHAGIVSIFERGFAKDPIGLEIPYCAMELVNGDSLRRYCLERRLGADDCLEIMRQVCAAIGYAHSRKVVHRDLKPGNILIDHAGQPRVLDFGLALVIDKCSPIDLLSLGMGTPGYLAPEQISHEFGKIGYATDVYSLGVILYELLGKSRPYQADPTKTEFRLAVTRSVPPKLGCFDSDLGGEIETIVATCLEKHPAERYPHANALHSVLSACLDKRRISRLARELGLQKGAPQPPPLPRNSGLRPQDSPDRIVPPEEAPTLFHDRSAASDPAPKATPSSKPSIHDLVRSDPISGEIPLTGCTTPASFRDPGRTMRVRVWGTVGAVCLVGMSLIVVEMLERRGKKNVEFTTEGILAMQSALRSGSELFDSGSYREAAAEFSRVLEGDPQNETALIGRARALHALGDSISARRDIRTLQELAAFSLEAQRLLNQFWAGGEVRVSDIAMSSVARETWTQLPDLQDSADITAPSPVEPSTAPIGEDATLESNYQKGIAHLQRRQYREAIESLKWVAAKSPHYKETNMNMAVAYFQLDQHEEALRKFDEIIGAFPDANNAYNFRGQCHLELGNYEKAVADFSEFLLLTPDFANGYNFRGQAYLKLKEYRKAEEDFTSMIRLEPGSSIPHEFRGRARIALGRHEEALADLDRAASLNRVDADIFYFRSKAQRALGRMAEADQSLAMAIQLNPRVVQQHEKRKRQ